MPNKPTSKRILGIDPGYDRVGIAVIDKVPGARKETLVYSDCLQTSSKEDIYERFGRIGRETARIMDEFRPEILAIENLFITKNQKTAMRVAEARGIIIHEAVKRGLEIHEYSPVQIKMAVTGDGTSDKDRIFKMVGLLIDMPKKKTVDDEYDAVAVALACSSMSR